MFNQMNTKKLLFLFIFNISATLSFACDCVVNTSAAGWDTSQVTGTITDFSCTGEPISAATLNFGFNSGSCATSNINIYVNGALVSQGICAAGTFDLTPYLPLNNVSVTVFDSDAYADWVALDMSISLYGQGGTNAAITDFGIPNFLCPGTTVTFNNQSTCAQGYNWYVNGPMGGTGFYIYEPTYTFNVPGNYLISLSTTDATGYTLGYMTRQITVVSPGNDFYMSRDSICPGETVQFSDLAFFEQQQNENNVVFTIDYGDGTSDVSATPQAYFSHAYPSLGQFIVTFSVSSNCGDTSFQKVINVLNNLPSQPVIDLALEFTQGVCPGTEVSFYTDWSQPNYLFNYGDGTTGTDGQHIYINPGTYYPSVTAENACGNVGTAYGIPVVVGQENFYSGNTYIGPYFNGDNPESYCPGTEIDFSTAKAQSYSWNFGDGGTSQLRYPKHEYNAPGIYNISVTLTDGCGNDTTLYTQVAIVNNLPVDPNISIDELPAQICVGDDFEYRISNGNQYTGVGSVVWNFGDGNTANGSQGYHSYSSPGVYTVLCTVTNACGNDTTLVSEVIAGSNIPPNVQFFSPQSDYCVGDEVLMVGFPYSPTHVVTWDMGNTDVVSVTDSIVIFNEGILFKYHVGTYTYNQPGTYTTIASVTNSCGLTASQEIILNIGNGAQIQEAGFFQVGKQYICVGEEVTFKGYGGNELFWNFGDNTGYTVSSGSFEQVTHVFENPGLYEVRMIAKNSCGDTILVTNQVFVPDNQMTIVTNSIESSCQQSNGTVLAYAAGPNPPYSYTWSCGQFTNVATDVPAGIYVVNVEDSKGCRSFAIATVSDEEAPILVVSNVVPVSCFGEDNGAIDITPIGNTEGITYQWSNGESSQDIYGLVAGPYEVVATNGEGCISVASVYVSQPNEVSVEFSKTPAACGFSSGTATALVTGTSGPYLYLWSNGQTGPVATGLAGGVYQVNVLDNESCLTQAVVAISETPAPAIIIDSINQVGCGVGGSGIYISPFGGNAPYTYIWSNSETSEDVTGLLPGQYSVKLFGADGCFSTEIFTIDYITPETDPICVVTVTSSQNNKIAWEKFSESDIAYYNIYRESSQAGLYYNIGRVPYDSLSIFIDTISNPAVQAYRYRVSAVDNCGTESELSSLHKTIHLTQNIGISGEVNLIWDRYDGFNYASYNILRYDDQGGWQQLASLPSNVNSYSDLAAPLQTATSLYYLVEVVLDQGCVSTRVENNNTTRSNRTEAIAGPLDDAGLIQIAQDYEFIVYPNPATGSLFTRISVGNYTNAELKLIDAQGRIVYSGNTGNIYDGFVSEINVSNLQNGVYTLTLSTSEKTLLKRIVIQN